MNYLDRLKQIDGHGVFACTPEGEPTEPPKAPSVSSVSTAQGVNAKTQSETAQAANDDGVTRFTWLMHFIDRNPLTVTFSPEVTHAGALACYPDAVAAEPIELAAELIAPPITTLSLPDDRRTCRQCKNLCGGVCTVAKPGGIVSAVMGYRPGKMFTEQLHRCEGFTERANDGNH